MADSTNKFVLRKLRQIFIWPLEAAIVFVMYFAARLLPVSGASWILGALMRILGPLTPWHIRARRNLIAAMPDLDGEGQNNVLRAMWWNIGRVIGEYPHISAMTHKGRVEFVGRENLQGLTSGGFLIGAHIGNW